MPTGVATLCSEIRRIREFIRRGVRERIRRACARTHQASVCENTSGDVYENTSGERACERVRLLIFPGCERLRLFANLPTVLQSLRVFHVRSAPVYCIRRCYRRAGNKKTALLMNSCARKRAYGDKTTSSSASSRTSAPGFMPLTPKARSPAARWRRSFGTLEIARAELRRLAGKCQRAC